VLAQLITVSAVICQRGKKITYTATTIVPKSTYIKLTTVYPSLRLSTSTPTATISGQSLDNPSAMILLLFPRVRYHCNYDEYPTCFYLICLPPNSPRRTPRGQPHIKLIACMYDLTNEIVTGRPAAHRITGHPTASRVKITNPTYADTPPFALWLSRSYS
jgi:hypothetical protein